MIISPKKAYDDGVITKLLNPSKQIGSDGIDLTVKAIARVDLNTPSTISETKTLNQHRNRTGVGTTEVDGKNFYVLTEGVYDVMFNEGCNLPKGVVGQIALRSSFVRNGCIGTAGVYDAGFQTDHAGFFLHVTGGGKLFVEENVRIAQIVLYKSDTYKLYDGQYNKQSGLSWLKSWMDRNSG
jgi:deoxycytidine triphosphate deaminase